MEYQVPQFTEVEDKIFGPLTLKQFIYVAGGVGICAILFLTLPFIVALFLAVPVGSLAGALAFFKVNGKSFIEMMEAGFTYYTNHRLYLWRKETDVPSTPQAVEPAPTENRQKLGLSQGKLQELAWSLDIHHDGKSDATM